MSLASQKTLIPQKLKRIVRMHSDLLQIVLLSKTLGLMILKQTPIVGLLLMAEMQTVGNHTLTLNLEVEPLLMEFNMEPRLMMII